MEQARLRSLIEKYHSSNLSDEEKEELDNWFHDLDLETPGKTGWLADAGPSGVVTDEMFGDLAYRVQEKSVKRNIGFIRWAAAAAFITCVAGGVFYFTQQKTNQHIAEQPVAESIVPGGNKAILALANGQKIILEDAQKGSLAVQDNATINKIADGSIVYDANDKAGVSAELSYNTLTTPNGGQYNLTLSDGTKVWLNAASSIKYPSQFKGAERKVEITGEAYFEVTHDAKMPFRVVVGNQVVEDLGTSFNINAYTNEPSLKTTLISGKAKVSNSEGALLLDPGQQAQLAFGASQPLKLIAKADITETIAWKNGLFKFRDASLYEVMRQVSRWYDVQIKYEGNIPDRKFTGEITRNTSIQQVLDILSYLKYQFIIDQKEQVIVIKN